MHQWGLSQRAIIIAIAALAGLTGVLITTMMIAGAQTEDASGLRIVHAGIDTPTVHVSINGAPDTAPVVWLTTTAYIETPAGKQEISIFDPRTSLDVALASAQVTTTAGDNYSAVISGELPEPEIVLLQDGNDSEIAAGQGAIRFFNSIPDSIAIDIATSDGTLLVEELEHLAASEYVIVSSGAEEIEFRESGTGVILSGNVEVEILGEAFQTTYISGRISISNFAVETFVDEYGGDTGDDRTTATERAATEQSVTTATDEPERTATPEPTATDAPVATAAATSSPAPIPALPSTGAGGLAGHGTNSALIISGLLATFCLAAGCALLIRSRRIA